MRYNHSIENPISFRGLTIAKLADELRGIAAYLDSNQSPESEIVYGSLDVYLAPEDQQPFGERPNIIIRFSCDEHVPLGPAAAIPDPSARITGGAT